MELVAAQGEQVRPPGPGVHGHLAEALGGIHQEEGALLPGEVARFDHRAQDPGLVVGGNDGQKRRIWPHRGCQGLQIQAPRAIHADVGHLATLPPPPERQGPHRRMLHLGGHQVALGRERLPNAPKGMVQPLGAARSEDHFGGGAADQRGYLLPRRHEGAVGEVPQGIGRTGIAKALREPGPHGLEDLGIQGSGGIMV